MPRVKAEIKTKAVERAMLDVVRNQIPFALSGSINDAMFRGRRFAVAHWARSFPNRRNRRFPGVVLRVRKASKRKLRGVLLDSRGMELINLQITGGIRRPRGRALAVPQPPVRRTRSGRVAKVSTRKLFRINRTLFRRVGRGKNKQLVPYFHLAPRAKIRAAYRLRPIVVRIRREFTRSMPRRLEAAIRTAR